MDQQIVGDKPRVVLSAGPGKLHLHQTARALAGAGASVSFVVGWVPDKGSRGFADFLGRILGERNLGSRMLARDVSDCGVRMCPNTMMEVCSRGLALLSRARVVPEDFASGFSFELAGFASRRYLRGADIFQVRSGAGQGGAIKIARKNGLKVLADHSIAHPEYMKRVLLEEYKRAGAPFTLDPNSRLWRLVLADCDHADRVVVNSDFVKRTFIECGFDPDRVSVAYLGVSDEYFGLKTSYRVGKTINLLFTGNFEIRKGVRVLLEAIRTLRRGGLDVRLHLIGNLANGGRWLQNSDKSFFRHSPFVAPDRLLPEFASADLFVFPTFAEGSSRSAMEAAAAGVPIITTQNCGLPLVNGESVVLVPTGDSDSLSAAIARLASDEAERMRLGSAARLLISREYSWPGYGRALMGIYRAMISG